jgi:hypothetical protein
MKLYPVLALLQELGFDDMPDARSAVEAAIASATPTVAADLGTPNFDRALSTDVFYIEEPTRRVGSAGHTEFKLTFGMVTAISAVTSNGFGGGDGVGVLDENGVRRLVTYAEAAGGVLSRFTNSVESLEKGILKDHSWLYNRETLTIQYEHGFETDANDPKLYDLDTVPDWLQQAAKLKALMTMAASPVMQQAQIRMETQAMKLEYQGIISAKRRYAPSAILPL